MKTILFFFFLFPLSLMAQLIKIEKDPDSPVKPMMLVSVSDGKPIFSWVEQMPQFPGGERKLAKFLRQNVTYTPEAKAANIHGQVVVQFVVDLDGSILDPEVIGKLGYGLDEEALRLINLFPKFEPGRQNGQIVLVRCKQVFEF